MRDSIFASNPAENWVVFSHGRSPYRKHCGNVFLDSYEAQAQEKRHLAEDILIEQQAPFYLILFGLFFAGPQPV